jgi:hypothetical protein
MNSSPAMTQKEYERRVDAIKVCGANRGPHDYIPIEWVEQNEVTQVSPLTRKRVTLMMCRVCFVRVTIKTLHDQFYEVKM